MNDNFSIIIPTLNEEHYLPRLLNSLVNQDYKKKFEVIVVDGESVDNTIQVANSYKNKIHNFQIIKTTKGVAHQRNVGANKARSDILIFLDADTVLPKNFLSTVVKKIPSNEKFISLPLILPEKGTILDYTFVAVAYLFFSIVRFTRPIVAGMCIITTKTNHKSITGFNEKVVFEEDVDYGLRSIRNGARYYLYMNPHLYTSTRRKLKIGRVRLGLLWAKGYLDTVKNGAITDASKYKYSFGDHHFEN